MVVWGWRWGQNCRNCVLDLERSAKSLMSSMDTGREGTRFDWGDWYLNLILSLWLLFWADYEGCLVSTLQGWVDREGGAGWDRGDRDYGYSWDPFLGCDADNQNGSSRGGTRATTAQAPKNPRSFWLFTPNVILIFTTFLNYRNKCLMPQSFVSCPLCFEFGNSNPHPSVHSVVIFGWILLQYSYLIHYQPIGSHLSSIEEENILYIFN